MQVKEKHLLIIIVVVVIAVFSYLWLQKTAQERKYKWEIKQLKLISEHQGLEIEVAKQRGKLEAMKQATAATRPSYKLTPKDPNK